MFRKALLLVISLGLVWTCFEIHRRMLGTQVGLRPKVEDADDSNRLPAGSGRFNVGANDVSGIRELLVRINDPAAGTVRTLYCDSFAGDTIDKRRARIRNVAICIHNKKRNTYAYLLADEAEILGQELDGTAPRVEEGIFSGNVELRYDRNGDTPIKLATTRFRRSMFWRGRRPMLRDDVAPAGIEADDFLLRADKLFFRESGQRVTIPGEISIRSREFFLRGRGLDARWSNVGQDVQYLFLEQGDKLVWYDGRNKLAGFTGDAPPLASRPDAAPAARPAEAGARADAGWLPEKPPAARRDRWVAVSAPGSASAMGSAKPDPKAEPKGDAKATAKTDAKTDPKAAPKTNDQQPATAPSPTTKPQPPDPKSQPVDRSQLRSYLVTFRRNVIVDATAGAGLRISALGNDGELTLDLDLFAKNDTNSDGSNPLFGTAAAPANLLEGLAGAEMRVADSSRAGRASRDSRDSARLPHRPTRLSPDKSAGPVGGPSGGSPSSSAPRRPAAPPSPTTAKPTDPKAPDRSKPVIISWQGPLLVQTQVPHADDKKPLLSSHQHMLLRAAGSPVRVDSDSGSVECSVLRADGVARWAVFESDTANVRMSYKDGSTIVGRHVIIRPAVDGAQDILVVGPGRFRGRAETGGLLDMPDVGRKGSSPTSGAAGAAGKKTVNPLDAGLAEMPPHPFAPVPAVPMIEGDFRESLRAELRWAGRWEPRKRDPATQTPTTLSTGPMTYRGIPLLDLRKSLTPVRFSLYEDVHLRSPEWSVRGMEVVMNFAPAEEWDSANKPVPTSFVVRHNVEARRQSDWLLADRLELPVRRDETGKFYVPEMVATGRVRARQAGTDLAAKDRLTVAMSRQVRGADGRPLAAGPGTPGAKWLPERFAAVGAVQVRDAVNNFVATGERMTGSLIADAAILFGGPSRPALVVQRRPDAPTDGSQDMVIESPDKLILHRFRDGLRADIEGRGRLTAPVDKLASLDGKPSDAAARSDPTAPTAAAKPGRMELTWRDGLEYVESTVAVGGAPPSGRVVARGDVRTVIERYDTAGGKAEDTINGGQVTVILDLRAKTDSATGMAAGMATGMGTKAGVPQLNFGSDTAGRKPRTLVLSEGAEIVSRETGTDGGSRLFILTAERDVTYHMDQRRLEIIGAGELAVDENARLPAPPTQPDAAPTYRRTQAGFRWTRRMEWHRPAARMTLVGDALGDVTLVSRGSDSLFKKGVGSAVGGAATGSPDASKASWTTVVSRLDCASLIVDMVNATAGEDGKPLSEDPRAMLRGDAGVRGFSSIRRFQAAGGVKFKEAYQQAVGDSVVFERTPGRDGGADVETFVFRGRPGKPAEFVEADPTPPGKFNQLRGNFLIGRRTKDGDLYFRAENAAGTPTAN